jgi:hypothetical protein
MNKDVALKFKDSKKMKKKRFDKIASSSFIINQKIKIFKMIIIPKSKLKTSYYTKCKKGKNREEVSPEIKKEMLLA